MKMESYAEMLTLKMLKNKVKAISPVPGGVGPMTIAMLLENTLHAYIEHERGIENGRTTI